MQHILSKVWNHKSSFVGHLRPVKWWCMWSPPRDADGMERRRRRRERSKIEIDFCSMEHMQMLPRQRSLACTRKHTWGHVDARPRCRSRTQACLCLYTYTITTITCFPCLAINGWTWFHSDQLIINLYCFGVCFLFSQCLYLFCVCLSLFIYGKTSNFISGSVLMSVSLTLCLLRLIYCWCLAGLGFAAM